MQDQKLVVKSGWTKFHYTFWSNEKEAGYLKFPDWLAVPKNGALKNMVSEKYQSRVEIEDEGQKFFVDYTITAQHTFGNNLQFQLMKAQPGGETQIATADVRIKPRARAINYDNKTYLLVNRNGWFSLRFIIECHGQRVGEIRETTGFSLAKRTYEMNLPSEIGLGVRGLFFFVAANATYR